MDELKNREERMLFVSRWADYVRTHDDKDWSRQQNLIIDSCLKTASMSKETYLAMKKKDCVPPATPGKGHPS